MPEAVSGDTPNGKKNVKSVTQKRHLAVFIVWEDLTYDDNWKNTTWIFSVLPSLCSEMNRMPVMPYRSR